MGEPPSWWSASKFWPGSRGDWTTDGRYFVYDREEPGAFRQDLFAQREPLWYDVRARGPERLTVGPLSFWSPGVSRDGRRLFAFGRLGRGELMRLDPKTKTFAPALGGKSAIYVEPSPDGEWLAWVRYPEGTLWKSRSDGSHELQLTSRPLEAHLPRWSADGRAIVFAARTPEEPQLAIYRVAADGSAQDVVFRSRGAQDHLWDPCWRSDGTLVFSRAGSNPSGILAARSENRARHAVARRRDTALAKVLETGGPAGSGRAPCGFAVCGAPARSRSMGRPWTRDAPVPAVDSGWSLGLRHRLLYRANRLPLHRVQADHHSSRRAAVSTPRMGRRGVDGTRRQRSPTRGRRSQFDGVIRIRLGAAVGLPGISSRDSQPGQRATPSPVHWTVEFGPTTSRAHRRPALACSEFGARAAASLKQTCRNRSRRPFRLLAASGYTLRRFSGANCPLLLQRLTLTPNRLRNN